jgi:hydrogenase/urease accessory protein HupE
MRRLICLLAAFFALLAPMPGNAHQLDPGYLDLAALGQDRWRVTWRVPNLSGSPMQIAAVLPEDCTPNRPPALRFDGRAWSTAWLAECPEGLSGGRITIEGLERTSTDAIVRYEPEPGKARTHRLTATETSFTVPTDPGVLEVVRSYVSLGVSHILEGVDHLLFILALLLLINDWRKLLLAVTAFTVAHSLTLAAASLGVLRIPAPPVEAVIALSIVFLAYELTLSPGRRDPITERFPWVVSFGFGLVHGLGFAGALREIGLPEGDIPLALFSFNLGVEIGQVMFVTAVLAAGATARLAVPSVLRYGLGLIRATSYAIGSVAAFWVIQRVAAF